MNKEQIKKLLAKLDTRKAGLVTRSETIEDVTELRGMTAQIDAINGDITELRAMLDAIPDEPVAPVNAIDERTAAVNSSVPGVVTAGSPAQERSADPTDIPEYRSAFREFVVSGTPIPAELRANATTKITDVASVIPTVIINKIIEHLESFGMILPLVTRTSIAAGVQVPTSSVKPVATWVAEGASSDRQKKTTGKISFTHHKLRCEVGVSMEVGTMAISAFEAMFSRQVAEAMVKAIEGRIVSDNTGSDSNEGILSHAAPDGQNISAPELTYKVLVDAEAALPQAYENGAVWCMTKSTFMGFIGMVDTNKQPIARINYGISGKPERFLLGRAVVLCGDYMPTFAKAAAGEIPAFIFNFSDYALNTIYDMGVQRQQDWDTEDLKTKAVMSVDGKVLDVNSLVTVTKTAA